ncbi:MAG: class I SAM-dependent methyltransferase [Gemmatimonadota bacterium]|nr:MAG: class I SAM-dependent methyltransferase [Gemmatimonadota bacterium]
MEERDRTQERKRAERDAFGDVESYQELMDRPYTKRLKEEVHRRLARFRLKDTNILEIGAGVSEFKQQFDRDNLFVASDYVFSLLNQNPLRRGLVVCDGEILPFANNRFDLVLLIGVLHHLVDQSACLEEVRRVLRRGGHVFVCEPHRRSLNFFYYNLRLLVIKILGVRFVKWLIGCFTPGESQVDIKAVRRAFEKDCTVKIDTILVFRLPPLRLFKNSSVDVKLSGILDRIPIVNKFGSTVFIEIEANR